MHQDGSALQTLRTKAWSSVFRAQNMASTPWVPMTSLSSAATAAELATAVSSAATAAELAGLAGSYLLLALQDTV